MKSFAHMNISVIIPVYGVEKHVGRCVESLMQQTMQDGVEFIFVDDATPDRSIEVIERVAKRYPARKSQIRIVRHSKNKGLPAARNTGLSVACGEYVFHWDSDDYAEPDMLEKMLETAEENNADYVWADWFLAYGHTNRLMIQPDCKTTQEALNRMLTGQMKYNVWNKLVRRRLYTDNDIFFPEGFGMGEDMTMIRLLACATTVCHCPYACYHYVKTNPDAMTETATECHWKQIIHNVEETLDFLFKSKVDGIDTLGACFKLSVKFPLLISGRWLDYRQWKELWPEANRFIGTVDGQSVRNKFLQKAANYKLYWLVWLHYQLYSVLYSLKYKR